MIFSSSVWPKDLFIADSTAMDVLHIDTNRALMDDLGIHAVSLHYLFADHVWFSVSVTWLG